MRPLGNLTRAQSRRTRRREADRDEIYCLAEPVELIFKCVFSSQLDPEDRITP